MSDKKPVFEWQPQTFAGAIEDLRKYAGLKDETLVFSISIKTENADWAVTDDACGEIRGRRQWQKRVELWRNEQK